MKKDERKEQTIFNKMLRKHKAAIIEVKTISNKNYKQDETSNRPAELFPTEGGGNVQHIQQSV